MNQNNEGAKIYQLVKADYAKASIFYPSGAYDAMMNGYLLVWILEMSQGGMLLKNIDAAFRDLEDVIQKSTRNDFYPHFNRGANREIHLKYDEQWYRTHDALEGLCDEGYLEKGMPIYQVSEKGKLELSQWQKAIAEFLLKCDIKTVEQIIRALLKGKEIFDRQRIEYIKRQAPRDPY